ncbi:MAG: hypothetical protein ACKOZU_06235 [Planctomycetaceae bacterium]
MNARRHNERKFPRWRELPQGGRLYWLDVPGKMNWRARYCKEVDAEERTLRFWQEIYDETGMLVEVHEKYPVDRGHRKEHRR